VDGGVPGSAEWRSSIPGVSQRVGAPATLGLVAWGTGPGRAQGGVLDGALDGGVGGWPGEGWRGPDRAGRARVLRGLPWRVLALAALALPAVLGVARVAGADAGGPAPVAGESWDPVATAETSAPAQPDPGNVPTSEPPDWWRVFAELDRRRARALTALDPELLADYAQAGSPAWSADAALVSDLRERGLRPRGLTSRVLAVERSERQGEQAKVQVVDQRSAYSLVDAQGSVVELVPQAGLTRWWVTLSREAGDDLGWRVADVTAVSDGERSGEAAP
jgi:eukaryotic-like serine/threonine-protein kinase